MAKVYKGTGTKIARMAGNHVVMDEAAEKIRARAAANAAAHRDTGAYSGNFKTKRVKAKSGSVTDRMVYNDHPANYAIEFGHYAKNAAGELGEFVPGQFNLTKAVDGE